MSQVLDIEHATLRWRGHNNFLDADLEHKPEAQLLQPVQAEE